MNTDWERNSDVHLQIVLQRAVRKIDGKIGKDFREKGITSSQFSVLDVLYTKGEMRICELIEKVLSTSGNMTVVVKNMEKKVLVMILFLFLMDMTKHLLKCLLI